MSEAATVVAPPMPLDRAVEKYLALRDKVVEIKKAQIEQLAPYSLAMSRLEGVMLAALNETKLDAMKAPAGTFYKHTTTSVKVQDWPVTLKYIQDHGLWELLEARVNKTAVHAMVQETSMVPPGVSIDRCVEVQVRRA